MRKFQNEFKRAAPSIYAGLHSLRMSWYRMLGILSPRKLIRIWHRNVFGREIDLVNPRTIDEKVNWMKLHADISLWVRCADKVEVRDYVREKGLGATLNQVFGIYDRAEDIDFDALPERFVLKTANGGGGRTVMLVPSREGFNEAEARRTAASWLRRREGLQYYEPQYMAMKPRIIAERFLDAPEGEGSLVDIKINCVDGRAHSVFLCSDRDPGKSVCYSVYDLDWNLRPECIKEKYRTDKLYPRPESFGRMLEYSERLAGGIPFVRVDWYEIDGEPVFSEMTFTPGGGFQGFYSDVFLNELGKGLDLSKVALR